MIFSPSLFKIFIKKGFLLMEILKSGSFFLNISIISCLFSIVNSSLEFVFNSKGIISFKSNLLFFRRLALENFRILSSRNWIFNEMNFSSSDCMSKVKDKSFLSKWSCKRNEESGFFEYLN